MPRINYLYTFAYHVPCALRYTHTHTYNFACELLSFALRGSRHVIWLEFKTCVLQSRANAAAVTHSVGKVCWFVRACGRWVP